MSIYFFKTIKTILKANSILASTVSAYALTKKIDIGLAFASDYFHQF